MKKRILSAFMALALCLTLLPAPAWAEETENNVAAQANTANVAEVTVNGNTTPYTDIDAAFAAAQEADSATVKLLTDVTISKEYNYGIQLKSGNITLDLNGKTLSKSTRDDNGFLAKNAVFWLSPPGATTKDEFLAALGMPVRLTVQDSSVDKTGKIVQPNGGPAVIATLNTILTVNGGTIENASSVDLDDDSHMKPNCAVLLSGGGKVVINGGTLSGMRGVAVTGYITKEEEGIYKESFGIEGYNNDTYGNELTVTGGNICATSGEALIVYEKAKKIELSGGTFTTQSNDCSIWAADTEPEGEPMIKGDAASLLKNGCRYEYSGTECAYSANGNGVVGNATVAPRPANEYAYIDKNGKLTTQANCTEITERTDDISTPGWYVVKENLTISSLNISGEVDLILCDEATLTVSNYMNVTAGGTLNLFWQSAGSGKLTAAAISVLGTVTAPAGEMKQTAIGNDGATFEKCLTHEWGYTDNKDGTHTATCKLCGKAEAAAHSYDTLQSTDAENHTFACACGATKAEKHTLTCTPNADGLTHSGKCSVCGYAAAAGSHSFDQTDEYGKKCECGAYLAAEYNGRQYATLTSAIEAAKDGGTVTLQAATVMENITIEDGTNVTIDLNGKIWTLDNTNGAVPVLTVTGGSVTVKNGKLMSGSTSYAATAVEVEGGKLTVGKDMTIQGGMDADRQFPAIDVKGGELTLSEGTELVCGMRVPEGKQLKDYLPEGTAFQQTAYDQEDPTETAKIINGYVQECVGEFTLTVVTHTTHNMTGGACACGLTCAHETVENGVCTVCKQQMKAKTIASNGAEKYYLDLQDAFAGVADGGTVTMLTTLKDDDTISFCNDTDGKPVDKTVTLMMNGNSLSYDGNTSLNIQSGKLIISDDAAISQPARAAVPAVFVDNNDQDKDRGTLEFQGKANLTGGLLIQNYGKLVGGLKEGTIITSNGTYSVSVERSTDTYTYAADLLPKGYAFAKYDESAKNKAGAIVNGYVKQLTEDVIVVKHTHSIKCIDNPNPDALYHYIYTCDCGFVCPHDKFTNSICDICHTACTHDEYDSDGTCARCHAQSAVLVEYKNNVGIVTPTRYMQTNDENGNDVTLQKVFDEAADGSTVTLLVDGLRASGTVTDKTIKLNLDGKSLIEGNGLVVTKNDENSAQGKLIVTGSGSSTTPENAGSNICMFRVQDGGELLFDNAFSGSYGTIYVEGGTLTSLSESQDAITIGNLEIGSANAKISFKAGKFGKITSNDSVKLGTLLAKNCGCAFQKADGEFVLYNTVIDKEHPIETVKIAACIHDSVTNGTCDYCSMENLVAAVIDGGGSIATYAADSGSEDDIKKSVGYALSGWSQNGTKKTLKLYMDFALANMDLNAVKHPGTGESIQTQKTIDLNGHTITGGTLTAHDLVTLTITDSSEGKKGSFANVTVTGSSSLTVDGVSVGKITAANKTARITLKASSRFTEYQMPAGMVLAQWIEDGNCISGGVNLADTTQLNGRGSFAVEKAPAAFSAPTKSGTIRYNGLMSEEVIPGITLDAGSNVSFVHMRWYYSKGDSFYMMNQNGTIDPNAPEKTWRGYVNSESVFNHFPIGNTISDVFCVLTPSDGSWSTVLHGYSFTLAKGDLSEAKVNATNLDKLVYTPDGHGSSMSQQLQFSVTDNAAWNKLKEGTDYQVKDSSDRADTAGEHTLVLEGLDKYAGSTLEYKWTVKPRELTGMTGQSKPYDGTTDLLLNDSSFTYGENGTVELKKGTDFTVTGGYDSADAGDRTVTATVTLTNQNYTFEGGKTQKTFTIGNVSIDKASASELTTQNGTFQVANNHAATYTYDVSALLPKLESPKKYGEVTYELGTDAISFTTAGYYDATKGNAEVKDGKLILPIQAVKTDTIGNIGSVKVKVSTTNYHDFTLTINVNSTNKIVPTGTPTLSKTTLAWGEQLSTITLSGAMKDGDTEVKGRFEWVTPETKMETVGEYQAEWKFTPTDTAVYAETSGKVKFTVIKATPTGAPKYTAITTGGKTLKDANLTVGTIQPTDGAIKWELSETTVVTANTAYKWVFTPKDQEHYNELTGSITPYSVSNTGGSSGGSSSGGGGGGSDRSDRPSSGKTDTTTRPDGTKVQTETKADGTKIQTETKKDGSVTKTTTNPNGSSVTETKAADGSTGTVKTDKNGQTTAETTLSSKAIEDAKKSGEPVKAPVEVKASRDSGTAPTVKVELPRNSGDTKVEIPVTNVKPGTVAVLVHADGTEEIVKNSLPTEDGIQLTVNGGATVKIVDNSKDFADTRNHWAKDAIDFVSARGLVNGMNESTFSPNAPTTRAQLWTILARQNDANLNGGSVWYEKAQLWSKDKGISDGTEPNAAINRAQMVTMLWRAVGQPAAGGTANFTDVPADSYYVQAVAWAVENGITTGVGNGRFDPNSTCTRAQIATFLYRYMK